jgi:hypothetical protein
MAESSLWTYLKKNMQGYGHWIRVENAVEIGTPDVNGCCKQNGYSFEVWIELKSRPAWPKRASTPVTLPHFTDEQKQWLIDRHRAGGAAFLFARVAREYFLFTPARAYMIETLPREEWYKVSTFHSKNRVDWEQFRRALWRLN